MVPFTATKQRDEAALRRAAREYMENMPNHGAFEEQIAHKLGLDMEETRRLLARMNIMGEVKALGRRWFLT